MTMVRGISGLAVVLGVGLSAPLAHAQPTDAAKQEAQRLYQDAAKAMDARDYAQACAKLEVARKILPEHIRTAISLAECYDKLGAPATALKTFQEARALANAEKNTEKQTEIDTKMAALEPRVPHLTISVPKDIASLTGIWITCNSAPIPATQWGNAIAFNPGTYQIEVRAIDKAPWRTSAEVQIGKDSTVEIKPPWNTPPTAPAADQNVPRPEPTISIAETPPAPSSPLRTVGIVGISLGVVGMGAGAILGGMALSKNNASDDGHCKANNVCDQIGFDLRTEARSLGNGSTAALVVGGVLLAGGVVLVVVGGKNKESRDKGQTSVWMGPTSVGVRGRW